MSWLKIQNGTWINTRHIMAVMHTKHALAAEMTVTQGADDSFPIRHTIVAAQATEGQFAELAQQLAQCLATNETGALIVFEDGQFNSY